MSAPDASWACTMTAGDEYFPVPTMSREEKVFPAMTRLSMSSPALSAPDEVDDLHLIAFADLDRFERPALEHHEVVLDRDAPRVDVEPHEQKTDGQRAGDLERIAVQSDLHVWNDPEPARRPWLLGGRGAAAREPSLYPTQPIQHDRALGGDCCQRGNALEIRQDLRPVDVDVNEEVRHLEALQDRD